MRNFSKVLAMLALVAICGLRPAEAGTATKQYVVTNNDVSGPNTVTFYRPGAQLLRPA